MAKQTVFERVFGINLDRRHDRYQKFLSGVPGDWPFAEIQRFSGVDGRLARAPSWWDSGDGGWGCLRSHQLVLENCLRDGIDSVLIFEDDAVFCDGFSNQAIQFIDHLPEDWNWIYLGGQHIDWHLDSPRAVNRHVYRPFNVNRSHALGLRGRWAIQQVYRHLMDLKHWRSKHHLDHHLGELHKTYLPGLYCPTEWLVQQRADYSDISGSQTNLTRFIGARALAQKQVAHPIFVLVCESDRVAVAISELLNACDLDVGGRVARGPRGREYLAKHADPELEFCVRRSYSGNGLVRKMSNDRIQRMLANWASVHSAFANRPSAAYHPLMPLFLQQLPACEQLFFLVVRGDDSTNNSESAEEKILTEKKKAKIHQFLDSQNRNSVVVSASDDGLHVMSAIQGLLERAGVDCGVQQKAFLNSWRELALT